MEEKNERPAADELPLFEDTEKAVPPEEKDPATAEVREVSSTPASEPATAEVREVPAATTPGPVPPEIREVPAAAAPEPVPPEIREVPSTPAPPPQTVSAPAAAPKPDKPPKTPPSPGTPRRCLVPAGLQPTPEFGKFLRQVREANGISLDDLARQTRIKRSYLDAVERESYSEMPAVVYALAYIKVLANYYGVDEEGLAVLTSEVRTHLECEVPEVNKTVVGYEISDENRVLLRRILYVGAGGVFVLAVAVTLAVLFFTAGRGEAPGPAVRGGAAAGPDEDRLVELQPKPVLKSHILPVPKR